MGCISWGAALQLLHGPLPDDFLAGIEYNFGAPWQEQSMQNWVEKTVLCDNLSTLKYHWIKNLVKYMNRGQNVSKEITYMGVNIQRTNCHKIGPSKKGGGHMIRSVFTSNPDGCYTYLALCLSARLRDKIFIIELSISGTFCFSTTLPPISWLAAAGLPVGHSPYPPHTLQWHRSAISLALSLSQGKVSRKSKKLSKKYIATRLWRGHKSMTSWRKLRRGNRWRTREVSTPRGKSETWPSLPISSPGWSYRLVTVRKLTRVHGVSTRTINATLHNDLNLSKKSARWVPKLLSNKMKKEQVRTSEEFLKMIRRHSMSMLDNIVTMDESAVFFHKPETTR